MLSGIQILDFWEWKETLKGRKIKDLRPQQESI
jgi:hypothetical protein